jgi:hypothetical protein
MVGVLGTIGAGSVNAVQSAQTAVDAIDELKRQELYENIKGFITIARIISGAPVTGVYRISAGKNRINDYAILLNNSSNRVYGEKDVPNYAPGTEVLVFIAGDESDNTLPNVILGAVNATFLEPEIDHLFSKYAELSAKSGVEAGLRVDQKYQMNEESGSTLFLKDFSYGRPIDVLPCEWARINALNGGFFLNDFLAFIKASEMAKIECFLFDNTVKLSWEKLVSQNAGFDERIFYDRFGMSRIRGLASTLSEGLGGLGSNPGLTDSTSSEAGKKASRVWQVSDEQRGYFSSNTLEGSLVDGSYEFLTIPPDQDLYTEDKDVIAPGLLSEEKRLDGTYKLKAAKEVSLEKTVYIVSPKELADSDTADNSEEKSFEREPWGKNHPPIEDVSIFGRQALDEYEEHENTKNAFAGLRSKSKYWEVKGTKQEVYDAFNAATGAEFKPEFEIKALTETDPHYTEPARKATVTPFANAEGVRADEVEVFDVSSAIKQLEDGSIVIQGGHGEEIRMYKGNIYLSCPGDIVEQPGRDKVTFAPRHNIQKACKGNLELTSNNSAILGAAGNLQLVAAASGQRGTLVIENKSKVDINTETFDPEGDLYNNIGSNGGIILKSASMLAMLSNHNYIGYSGENYGSSITQINSGSVLTNTEYHITNIESGGTYSINHLGGGALTLGSGIFEALAQTCSFGCSTAEFTAGSLDTVVTNYLGENAVLNINTGDANLLCKGQGIFKGVRAISGAIDGLVTTSGSVGKDPTGPGAAAYANVPTDTGDGAASASSLQGVFTIFASAAESSLVNLKKISTVLPSTSAYAVDNFYMPLNTWQAILEGGQAWTEMKVPNDSGDSMPFPGKTIWEGGKGLKAYEEGEVAEKSLKTEYIINTAMNKTGV